MTELFLQNLSSHQMQRNQYNFEIDQRKHFIILISKEELNGSLSYMQKIKEVEILKISVTWILKK